MKGFILQVLVYAAIIFVIALIFSLPTMWLWNWLIPHITKGMLSEITWLEAFGLEGLMWCLFGGCRTSNNNND